MLEKRIGFIGAGQMATALAGGLIEAGLTSADRLLASDVDEVARRRFAERTGATTTADNASVAAQSDILLLAVKPQQIAAVAAGVRGQLGLEGPLIVSIAAGVSLATLAKSLGQELRIVRVMPNAPCVVRQGTSAYCLGAKATVADGALVGKLLGALGSAWLVEEKLLDAVTGLAASAPALVYVIIEALADAGVAEGLPRSIAAAMAAETVRGAAEMVLATGEHPAVLRDRVASPAGTTIAGLRALEAGGARAAMMAAVEAATRRSRELGQAQPVKIESSVTI
ncbi:MAG: pyrroline-5-carboxylate reductase [Planctomycetaceae bacterium]|nr:pyrroline-5-carboxylate reductase [Planctomycetaceae bacterium]